MRQSWRALTANGPAPGGRPEYRPYRWATADFQLDLRPIKPAQWMLIESEYAAILREKRARMADFPELYYRALPCSLPAQHELREGVVTHLAGDYPDQFRRAGSTLQCLIDGARYALRDESIEPLRQMSRFIEEEFMLMQEIESAQMITAASNAYSSSGRLVASVGKNVAWAHEPVPQLTAKLGARIAESLRAILALMRTYSDARLGYSEMNYIRESVIAWLESAVNPPV